MVDCHLSAETGSDIHEGETARRHGLSRLFHARESLGVRSPRRTTLFPPEELNSTINHKGSRAADTFKPAHLWDFRRLTVTNGTSMG